MTNARSGFNTSGRILRYGVLALAVILITTVNVLRFHRLDRVPAALQVDEASSGVALACLAQAGTDADSIRYPLFANMHYGTPKPPTYLYPGMLWVKAFGFTPGSLRGMSAFMSVLGLVGLFCWAGTLMGWGNALWVLLAGSLSPWLWTPSRLIFEAQWMFVPLVWALYFFFSARRAWQFVLAGVFFSLTMYSYPAGRPLIVLLLPVVCRARWRLSPPGIRHWVFFSAALFVATLPLAHHLMTTDVLRRYGGISVFSHDNLAAQGKTPDLAGTASLVTENYFSHFSWKYLWLTGDPDYKHSTQKFGILSWFDLAGLLLGLLMMIARVFSRPPPSPEDLRRRTILQLCLCAYLVGLVPAAFTLGCPHAIRTMGAWPFLMLAAGCFWEELIRRWAPAALLAVLLAGLFAKAHVGYYFKEYPARSAGMFAPWIRSTAESVHGPEDFLKLWYIAGNDYYYRYYVMLLYNRPCKGSFDEWFQIRDLMNRAGIKK